MNYVGIDIHKRYSVCATQDEQGRLRGARIEGNSASAFAQYLAGLDGPCKIAIEACWNWGTVYDRLAPLPQVKEVVVAHPLKTRLIGEAQIKTDKIDAQALGTLLRGNFIARVHVPPKAVRQRKDQLRQRLYFARLRTKIRNRTHALLDRQESLKLPQCSDLFGAKGPRPSAPPGITRARRRAPARRPDLARTLERTNQGAGKTDCEREHGRCKDRAASKRPGAGSDPGRRDRERDR